MVVGHTVHHSGVLAVVDIGPVISAVSTAPLEADMHPVTDTRTGLGLKFATPRQRTGGLGPVLLVEVVVHSVGDLGVGYAACAAKGTLIWCVTDTEVDRHAAVVRRASNVTTGVVGFSDIDRQPGDLRRRLQCLDQSRVGVREIGFASRREVTTTGDRHIRCTRYIRRTTRLVTSSNSACERTT